MIRHGEIWHGMDSIAKDHSMSVSALACLAGLDPTSFNKSKREAKEGHPRWPSTESLPRALDAVGMEFDEFAQLVEGEVSLKATLIGFAKAGSDGFFGNAGFRVDGAWDEVEYPASEREERLYALEISFNSMEPTYRAGDRIIVSPTKEVYMGDRGAAKILAGEVMAKTLKCQTLGRIELESLDFEHGLRVFPPADLAWIARILWVSRSTGMFKLVKTFKRRQG